MIGQSNNANLTMPMYPSRKFCWISAVDPKNASELDVLEQRMATFYASTPSYYSDIEFSGTNWLQQPSYINLAQRLSGCRQIAEIGCGSAAILRHYPQFEGAYAGCDFSQALLANNLSMYRKARFERIANPRSVPFENASMDAVFSVFVIEHTVRPHEFLDECLRVLRTGGLFALICPNFIGRSCMSSQRTGFSHGPGREKLRRGRILDALVTAYDSRVRIPRHFKRLRSQIEKSPAFYVNTAPICFDSAIPFGADYDAVYLTYAPEIVTYLRTQIDFDVEHLITPNADPIYLVGRKR